MITGYRIHAWDTEPVLEAFDHPEPGPGEVLVEVEACGVGLTVINAIRGDLGNDPGLLPRVPGHELVGVVADIGPDTDRELVGRRVIAYFYLTCGLCLECRAGRDPLCQRTGGFVGVHRDGGYAPYVVLPVSNVIPIPESLDPIAATVVPDAVATPVHVATRAALTADDRVVVIGAGGGVGIHMVQVARLTTTEVVGLDVTPEKLDAIESVGVRAVDSSDFAELTDLFVGGPPTVVIDLAGLETTGSWAIDTLAPGGRFVVLTTFVDQPITIQYRDFVFREIALLGSRYATKTEVAQAADLVASGQVRPVIGQVVGPDDLPSLHHRLRSGELVGRGALSWET